MGSMMGSMKYPTPHCSSVFTLGSSVSMPVPEARDDHDASAGPASSRTTSRLESLTLNTRRAPASTAVRISAGSNESTLTRIPAATRACTMSPSAGKGSPGVQPISMMSAPESRKYCARCRISSRLSRGALLISATISMSHAPYAAASGSRPKYSGMSRRSLGPRTTCTPGPAAVVTRSDSGVRSPSQSPGIMTRSTSPGTSRKRAIHAVVMSAATVILSTATV